MRLGELWHALSDLVLPASCAACGAREQPLAYEVCPRCQSALQLLRAGVTRPDPAPAGLPECVALGEYGGELRELLLAYKERGRHRLARPLGALLAEAMAAAVGPVGTVLVLYVPDTAAAARARHGDHMRRLAKVGAARLRRAGWRVVVGTPLRALPRRDSAALDAVARAQAAAGSFALGGREIARLLPLQERMPVLLVDDIITTGVTLAAAVTRLSQAGVRVDGCVTLAATRRLKSVGYAAA